MGLEETLVPLGVTWPQGRQGGGHVVLCHPLCFRTPRPSPQARGKVGLMGRGGGRSLESQCFSRCWCSLNHAHPCRCPSAVPGPSSVLVAAACSQDFTRHPWGQQTFYSDVSYKGKFYKERKKTRFVLVATPTVKTVV